MSYTITEPSPSLWSMTYPGQFPMVLDNFRWSWIIIDGPFKQPFNSGRFIYSQCTVRKSHPRLWKRHLTVHGDFLTLLDLWGIGAYSTPRGLTPLLKGVVVIYVWHLIHNEETYQGIQLGVNSAPENCPPGSLACHPYTTVKPCWNNISPVCCLRLYYWGLV